MVQFFEPNLQKRLNSWRLRRKMLTSLRQIREKGSILCVGFKKMFNSVSPIQKNSILWVKWKNQIFESYWKEKLKKKSNSLSHTEKKSSNFWLILNKFNSLSHFKKVQFFESSKKSPILWVIFSVIFLKRTFKSVSITKSPILRIQFLIQTILWKKETGSILSAFFSKVQIYWVILKKGVQFFESYSKKVQFFGSYGKIQFWVFFHKKKVHFLEKLHRSSIFESNSEKKRFDFWSRFFLKKKVPFYEPKKSPILEVKLKKKVQFFESYSKKKKGSIHLSHVQKISSILCVKFKRRFSRTLKKLEFDSLSRFFF